MLRAFLFTVAVLFAMAGQANAGLVYDNGPLNGKFNAYLISGGQSISDSFTVSSATNLVSAQLGLWTSPGGAPVSLDWSIGTSALGSDVSSGTATLSNTFEFVNPSLFNIFESTFALHGAVSPGTTYWLTLSFGSTTNNTPLSWDVNSGPSLMMANDASGTFPSESFQLYDAAVTAAPEPESLTLLGLGVASVAGYGWRRRVKVEA
jgi:hypothetical protein